MRVLVKKDRHLPLRIKAASGFDYPATVVGASTWQGSDGKPVTIYYDPSTGPTGLSVAQYILTQIDALMAYCDWAFGVKGQGGNVIVAPDFGGAYHYGCDFAGGGDWYESLSGNGTTLGLVMAEVVESYMGLQGKGWNCGGSGGEGLSRFLAEVATGGASGDMAAYAAGPSWDGNDWISRDQGTDQDYPSTGCSLLYCWWMTKLGYTVDKIIQAGEPDGTLKSNYAALTGKPASQAFADFSAAVAAVGGPGSFQSDNPFAAPNPPYPLGGTPPPPPPTCPPGQHWDPVALACVPDGPPPPPQTFTVDIPAQTIMVPHGWFGSVPVVIPAQTVTGVINASGEVSITIPPILLKLLKVLCAFAPGLPPPYGPLIAAFCLLLPANADALVAAGQGCTVKLTKDFMTALAKAALTIPPWLLAVLQALCASAGKLPAPWSTYATIFCAFLPKSSAAPCGGCK